MDLGAVDRSATQGRSWLHLASPLSKLIALGFVLAAVIVSWNALVLLGLALALASAAISARLDLRLTFTLAGYPAVFAAIFAFASAPDLSIASAIVLKAVTAALGAVIVILTTPYPQVFAIVQRVTPSLVGDALLMTYRSSFLLLGKFAETLRAVKLRAGLRGRHPVRSGKAVTLALGSVLLYGIDLSQRDYDVLRLRGYSGRLRVKPLRSQSRISDVLVVTGAATLTVVSLLWRIGFRSLNPWSWLVVVPALALLMLGTLIRWRSA